MPRNHRTKLHPTQRLVAELGCTHGVLAKGIGISRQRISQHLAGERLGFELIDALWKRHRHTLLSIGIEYTEFVQQGDAQQRGCPTCGRV